MRIALTIDVEWAPEFVIEWMVGQVKSAGVKATWFATHDSEAIRALDRDPHQEVGLHPNFFPGSTQGTTMEEVMTGLMNIYPRARGVRSHAFLDSTRHQLYYRDLGIEYISNIILWGLPSRPYRIQWIGLSQLPISWEDDVACLYMRSAGCDVADSGKEKESYVLNFHPLYCYLNEGAGMKGYLNLRQRYPGLKDVTPGILDSYKRPGKGLEGALKKVLASSRTNQFLLARDLVKGAA